MVLKTDKRGRLLLPKAIRDHLGIKPGDEIQATLSEEDNSLSLKAISPEEDQILVMTEWGFPIIYTKKTLPKNFDTVAFMKETYEEHFRKKLDRA